MPGDLENLIARSNDFHDVVHAQVQGLVPFPGVRYQLARDSGLLSIEHGSAALLLISGEFNSAAMALLRPQFETLVRGVWLIYAASDTWVEKLAMPLTPAAEHRASDAPMLAEMLKQLWAAQTAPKAVVQQLEMCRATLWKALNSFSHGGIHPLSKFATGYPPRLLCDALRNSNTLQLIACQLIGVVSGDPCQGRAIREILGEFGDCLVAVNSGARS